MAAIGGRRNFVEGVAPRSLPAAPSIRDIGCVRCVKRLEKDVSHKCIKRTGMKKCNYCRGQKHKCVPVPRFFRNTAYALVTDASAIAATHKPNGNVVRAFNSRIRGFRKRIERRGYVTANQPTTTDIPNLLAGLLVQATRLADYVARLADVPPEAEEEDGDYPDSGDDDDATTGGDEDE